MPLIVWAVIQGVIGILAAQWLRIPSPAHHHGAAVDPGKAHFGRLIR
jgi:hypothetical protein